MHTCGSLRQGRVKFRACEVGANAMPVAISFVAAAVCHPFIARCASKLKVDSDSNLSLDVATCVRFKAR